MKSLTVGSLIPGREKPHMKKKMEEVDQPIAKNSQSIIKVEQNGHVFKLKPVQGISLLDLALQTNTPIEYKCKKGTCGRCKVEVKSGEDLLAEPTVQEKNKLAGMENKGFRLACQAKVISV